MGQAAIAIDSELILIPQQAAANSRPPMSMDQVLRLLQPAKTNALTMTQLRQTLQTPLMPLTDDQVLHAIAVQVTSLRMVLRQSPMRDTASGKGMTTTIQRADGSIEVRKGNRPWRNYNPGDIEILPKDKDPFAVRHGSIGKEGAFAIFPDEKTGFAALKALLLTDAYQTRSILDTMKRFAPAGDHNDPIGYAAMLAGAVGVPASTKLSALTAAQLESLVNKIAQVEGYRDAGTVHVISAKR